MEMAGFGTKRPWPFGIDEHLIESSSPQTPRQLPGNGISDQAVPVDTCFGTVVFLRFAWNSPANHGQIVNQTAQLQRGAQLSQYRHMSRNPTKCFAVVREGNYFALEHEGNKFARLKNGLCSIFHELITGSQVRIQAYVSGRDWAAALQSWHPGSTALIPVELNIHGALEDANGIGTILFKSGIFLQAPRYGLGETFYYNPHLLHRGDCSGLAYPEAIFPIIADATDTPHRSQENEPEVDDSMVVDSILNELSHHVLQPNTVHVNRRIKSSLLL